MTQLAAATPPLPSEDCVLEVSYWRHSDWSPWEELCGHGYGSFETAKAHAEKEIKRLCTSVRFRIVVVKWEATG